MARRVAYRLSLAPRFVAELKHQIAWIAERNGVAAQNAEARVRVALRRLTRFPLLGRPGRVDGTRELSALRTRFIIAYRVGDRVIEVAALRHSSQAWPSDL